MVCMIQVHGLMTAKELRDTIGDMVRQLDPQFVWQSDIIEHLVHLSPSLYSFEDLADHCDT